MAERAATDADRRAVLATHQGFYDAVEAGDLDLMSSLWADDPEAVCVHPGTEAVVGTAAVLRSWALVMAQLDYVQFILTDVHVALVPGAGHADAGPADAGPAAAVVSCTENVLADAPDGSDVRFSGGRAIATTTLVPTGAGWRVLAHHSSLVFTPDEGDEG